MITRIVIGRGSKRITAPVNPNEWAKNATAIKHVLGLPYR